MQRELSKLFFISFFLGAKNPVRPLDKKKKFQLPKTSEVSNMQHEYQNQWGSCAIKRVYIKKKNTDGGGGTKVGTTMCMHEKSVWACIYICISWKRVQQINAQQTELWELRVRAKQKKTSTIYIGIYPSE